MNSLRWDDNRTFLSVAAVFAVFQVAKFFFWVPDVEVGGDAAQKWFLAKDIANGSVDVFRSTDFINHHFLRWATWVFPAFAVLIFGDELWVYYASTAIPSFAASLVFIWLSFRIFGGKVAVLFAFLWFFDPQMNRATFQLLPTGAGLLPLALLILCFEQHVSKTMSHTRFVLYVSLLLFWLYGAKETNIFFAPGVFFATWVLVHFRAACAVVFVCVSLYVLEAVVLGAMLGDSMPGGRMLALMSGEAKHITTMFEGQRIVAEQEDIWDSGILSRWYTVSPIHVAVYIPSIILFVYFTIRYLILKPADPIKQLLLNVCILALSFVLLTSFFFVSLDPIRLGQPIRPRYIAILLPLSLIVLVFAFCKLWERGGVPGKGAAVGGFFLSSTLGFWIWGTTYAHSLLWDFNTNMFFQSHQTLSYWQNRYAEYGKTLPDNICDAHEFEFKHVYFALMYVSETNSGADRFAQIEICKEAIKRYGVR